MVLGLSPLATSALRFVVILTLFTTNIASLFRTYRLPKYSGQSSFRRVTLLSILTLNIMYLAVIWAPFTIIAFKHNMQDQEPAEDAADVQASPLDVLEYLRLNVSVDRMKADGTIEESSLGQYVLVEVEDYSEELVSSGLHRPKSFRSDLGESLSIWITHVHDLVTSSFTYSLILTALVANLMAEKELVVRPSRAFLIALLVAVVPLPLTLAVRCLANTNYLFALHTPEVKSGYTMYSIICDVYISRTYVVGLFLELMVVVLMAAVLQVVMKLWWRRQLVVEKNTHSQDDDDSFVGEDIVCKLSVLTSGGLVWPIKPLLAIILYFMAGPHWNSAVCWLANLVVAIPVSFLPLAVLLPRIKMSNTYTVKDAGEGAGAAAEEHNIQNPGKTDVCSQCPCPEDVGLSPADYSFTFPDTDLEASGKRSQIKENLKFYLGTDIFKNRNKKEDEVSILSKQDGNESQV